MRPNYRIQRPGDAPDGERRGCRATHVEPLRAGGCFVVCEADGLPEIRIVCLFRAGDPNTPRLGDRGTLTFRRWGDRAQWCYEPIGEG